MSTPSKIRILQNLGNYENLNSFSILNHEITNIKTRLNSNLARLNCSYNNIGVTNFSQNTNLTHLTCTFNLLEELYGRLVTWEIGVEIFKHNTI